MKNYLNLGDFTSFYLYKGLEFVKVNGYIYRASAYAKLKKDLKTRGAYFGSFDIAKRYLSERLIYLKKFKTRRTIKLLELSHSKENIERVNKFFKELIKVNPDAKYLHILIQFAYGMIPGKKITNINMHGLTPYEVFLYYSKIYSKLEKTQIFVDAIGALGLALEKTLENHKDAIPSRVSNKQLNYLIATEIKKLFKSLKIGIDGIFVNNPPNTKNHVCFYINKYLEPLNMCVYPDFVVFHPLKVLDFVEYMHYK